MPFPLPAAPRQTALPHGNDYKLKNGGYSAGIALTVVGWTFTGIFGITALVMGILWGVGPAALGVSDAAFRVFPILFFCSYPAMLGFLDMAVAGRRKLFYFSRLRKLLRAARDWQCDLPGLARTALLKQEQVYKDVQKAVADGDFPGAAYSADFSTLYFDDTLYHPVEASAPAESPAPAEPLSEAEQFRRECEAFFAYLQSCRGCLGRDTDAELDAMQKTCRAMLDFTAAHPEQLPQLRRLRDYYLPTTRKLLDTALGLGDDTGSAADIRRDITAILHTLNLAYTKLYDTLLEDVSLDVSTEIGTLEAMLRQDGLTHDFDVLLPVYEGDSLYYVTDEQTFTDSGTIASWAKDATWWAVYHELVSGTGGSRIAPEANASRAQIAAILLRYADKFMTMEEAA